MLQRRRQWHPTPVLLPGKSHGRRSLVGCSPWGREELDMTEWLHFYFSLSCIGEGNGNPLQCSCLENPRDGGAWWAAVCGVAQSRTRLKQLGSSSSWCFSKVGSWWCPLGGSSHPIPKSSGRPTSAQWTKSPLPWTTLLRTPTDSRVVYQWLASWSATWKTKTGRLKIFLFVSWTG